MVAFERADLCATAVGASVRPKTVFFEEMRRIKPALDALGIRFSVSRAKVRLRGGRPRKPPYFACCYNAHNLGNVNITAFYYPLLADWEFMEGDVARYRQRIRSALQEEMVHSVQVMAMRNRFRASPELQKRYADAESYYECYLGRVIEELATTAEGCEAVLTAARLYYEDWTINSLERLRQADRRYHGRDGYMASELIRQLVQIRGGTLTSEEAKGKAWDKHRVFRVTEFGSTENLLRSMAATLRGAVPTLVRLSPALAEALTEIEAAIHTLHLAEATGRTVTSPTP